MKQNRGAAGGRTVVFATYLITLTSHFDGLKFLSSSTLIRRNKTLGISLEREYFPLILIYIILDY